MVNGECSFDLRESLRHDEQSKEAGYIYTSLKPEVKAVGTHVSTGLVVVTA